MNRSLNNYLYLSTYLYKLNYFTTSLFLMLAYFSFSSLPGHAVEIEIDYLYQGNITDNSGGVSRDQESDYINVLSSQFSLTERTSRLNAAIDYMVEGRNFTRNTFSDEVNFTGDATATLSLIPQSFTWFFSNQRRRSEIDSRSDDNPDNQQTTNTFTTGPRLNFRLSSVDSLFLSAQSSKIKTEDTRTDSERKLFSVGFIKQLSFSESISLNFDLTDVDFSSEFADNFQNIAAFFQIRQTRARASYTIDLGFNKVAGLVNSDSKGSLGRIRFDYLFPSLTQLTLSIDQSISDASNNIQSAPVITENSATTDIFVLRSINLSLSQPARGRVGWNLRLFTSRQDYEVDPLDEKRQGISFGADYVFSSLFSATVDYNYERTRFLDVSERDIEQDISIGFRYRWTRKLNINGSISYRERRSSVSVRSFNALSAGFTFSYDVR